MGKENLYRDVVVSSRIRLARNISDYVFPAKLSTEAGLKLFEEIKNNFLHRVEGNRINYRYLKMADMPALEKNMLVEKRLISPAILGRGNIGGLIVSEDESISIMINEEDHLRIQVFSPGFSLEKNWEIADQLDDIIEKDLNYAFDYKLGYLTSCPTNLGTGLRVSVMLHLPALEVTGQIDKVFTAISKFGLAIRGIYGEGSKSAGSLYQISNQTTLGVSEKEIIEKTEKIILQIIEKEKAGRKSLLITNQEVFEDKIFRAYGILKNARIISAQEALKLISYVKLGVSLELIENLSLDMLDKLAVETQPANIQYFSRKTLEQKERDIMRAKLIREKIR